MEGTARQRDALCGDPYKEYKELKRSGAVHVSQHRLKIDRPSRGKDL
jgi:hypothetical protein